MLNKTVAQRVIDKAMGLGVDFCEIFAEDRDETNIAFAHGMTSNVSSVHMFGAGLYLLNGTSSAYVYTSDASEAGLLRLVDKGAKFMRGKNAIAPAAFVERPQPEPNAIRYYPGSVAVKRKTAVLAETEKAVYARSHASLKADYAYFDTDQRVIIASSDGTWAEDRRITSRIRGRFNVSVGGESTGDWMDFTRAAGFECFEGGAQVERFVGAVRELEESLTADESPKGRFPVIFEAGDCVGTFFHEACGHQLETTNMQSETAYFRDKLGKKVASDKVTVIDDGTIPGLYGSSKYDDEGMPRRKNILIENGVLKSFLVDRLGSRQFNVPRNACGRRQNYTFAPCARMSNTYLAAGSDDPDEMISTIPFGILAVSIGGGTGGEEFTLNCPRAYLIKNGKIDRLLKSCMLLGRGDETMLKIDRVGKELVWEDGGAFCGASSGLCNTTTSGARMRVTEMVIG